MSGTLKQMPIELVCDRPREPDFIPFAIVLKLTLGDFKADLATTQNDKKTCGCGDDRKGKNRQYSFDSGS
jgi:hypothetical protein